MGKVSLLSHFVMLRCKVSQCSWVSALFGSVDALEDVAQRDSITICCSKSLTKMITIYCSLIFGCCLCGSSDMFRGPNDTGMSRLSLSNSDKQARDWFVETTESLGCKVSIDVMGNIFAVRPGQKAGPPTCAGSHLDTQPTGGRYV